jgi:hypothetical protein
MGKSNDRYTAEQFIKAIEGSGGLITTIAARVGCTWNTAKRYIEHYVTVQAAYLDECERINDMAQSKLMEAIKDGDVATAKWWLAKKRKAEFGESVELIGKQQHEHILKFSDDAIIRKLLPELASSGTNETP